MHYLLLAIVFSASMSIVLKIFREPKGNRFGIILGNYLTCIVLAFVTMPEKSRIRRRKQERKQKEPGMPVLNRESHL